MTAPWPFTQEEWDARKGEQTGTTSGGHWTPLMPGGESTSAQLDRVRQERDEARAVAEDWSQRYADLKDERDQVLSAFNVAEELRLKAVESSNHWMREWNLAIAELTSAQGELARLRADLAAERATAAQLRADYAEAADELQRTIPTSKETTMPATNDDGPILVASRSIFRQVIPVNDQWHTLHLRGPIVHVATRHEDCVEIWFIEDPTAGDEPRTLRVYGTGHAIDEPTAVHVGSAVTPSGQFVWHVLELPDRGAW